MAISIDSPKGLLAFHHKRAGSIAITLIALTVGVYILVTGAGFLNWDDFEMVVNNADLRPDHWPAICSYWLHPHLKLFIPLTYSVYFCLSAISYATAGSLQAAWFHMTNLALHVATGLIVWRILTRLSRSNLAGAVGAAVFLMHPLQVEAVSWVSSLNTVLAGFGAVSALWMFIQTGDEPEGRQRRLHFIAACVVGMLAILAKPSVCGLPLIVLAVDRLLLRRDWKRALGSFVCLTVLTAPLVYLGRAAQPATHATYIAWPRRIGVAVDAIGFYAGKLIYPVHLCIDYGRIPESLRFGGGFWAMAVAIGVSMGVVTWQFRHWPWLLAGAIISVAGLFPVLGMVPFDFQQYSTVADRYVYLSMLGPAVLITFFVRSWVARPLGVTACVCAVATLACLAHWQTYSWLSDESLFDQALAVNPQSVAAHFTLGFLAAQNADQTAADPATQRKWLSEAFYQYSAVLGVRPDHQSTHFNMGNLLLRYDHPDLAIPHYAAVKLPFTGEVQLQNNWGVAYLQVNQPVEAIMHFQRAIALAPTDADAYANAGLAYLKLGQQSRAAELFTMALSLNPRQSQALSGLGQLQAREH